MNSPAAKKRIQVIHKAVALLNCLTVKGGRSITEISKATGFAKPTVYTLLKTMEEEGLVYQDPLTKKYRLGLTLMRLGRFAVKENDLRGIALPVMLHIRDQSGESVHLNVVSGDERVCIESLDSKYDLRLISEIGERSKLYCGASAKVLLANLDEAEIEQILGDNQIFRLDVGQRVVTREELLAELARIRQQGYAISSGERIEGVSAVTAPIKNHLGKLVAGLSISIPDARFKAEKVPFLIRLVTEGALRISETLGYQTAQPTGAAVQEAAGTEMDGEPV